MSDVKTPLGPHFYPRDAMLAPYLPWPGVRDSSIEMDELIIQLKV